MSQIDYILEQLNYYIQLNEIQLNIIRNTSPMIVIPILCISIILCIYIIRFILSWLIIIMFSSIIIFGIYSVSRNNFSIEIMKNCFEVVISLFNKCIPNKQNIH